MGFSVPNIFTNIGNPIIDANAVNANFASISTSLNYIFDVRYYGAKWDGVTDDATAIQTAIIANDLTSTNITTPVDNASTTSKIADNLGYNPVGAMTAPTVGASPWTYTNNTGVDQTLNVSGGTISAISANGVATGLTSGSFLVPAGNTLVVTYTAAPTISASGN